MSECLTVFCLNWTGDGCACRVFGIDPVEVEHDQSCACRDCEAKRQSDACGECTPEGLAPCQYDCLAKLVDVQSPMSRRRDLDTEVAGNAGSRPVGGSDV